VLWRKKISKSPGVIKITGTCTDTVLLVDRVTHTHTRAHARTHAHNRLRLLVRDYPGRPVSEETLTHSHPSWSSDILYQLPLFTTFHSILCVQFTCLTVFDNLSPFQGLLLVLDPLLHTPCISSSFRSTCPYQRSLFCCNTNAMSSIPNLSLSSLLGNLS